MEIKAAPLQLALVAEALGLHFQHVAGEEAAAIVNAIALDAKGATAAKAGTDGVVKLRHAKFEVVAGIEGAVFII